MGPQKGLHFMKIKCTKSCCIVFTMCYVATFVNYCCLAALLTSLICSVGLQHRPNLSRKEQPPYLMRVCVIIAPIPYLMRVCVKAFQRISCATKCKSGLKQLHIPRCGQVSLLLRKGTPTIQVTLYQSFSYKWQELCPTILLVGYNKQPCLRSPDMQIAYLIPTCCIPVKVCSNQRLQFQLYI